MSNKVILLLIKSLLFLLSPPDIRGEKEKFSIKKEALQIFHEITKTLQPPFFPEPVSGEKRCIVLIGEFFDIKITAENFKDYLNEMFFRKPDEEPRLYPYPSMNEFYIENSSGKFSVTGDVYGIYPVPATSACYASGICNDDPRCPLYPNQDGGTCMGALNFVKEVVEKADAEVNFKSYDHDGNGIVDCLIVVHAGKGGEQKCETLKECNYLWSLSYAFSATGATLPTADGVSVDRFILGPELTEFPRNGDSRIDMGVYAHEFGHFLNLPDLYDTDLSSCGVGVYDLMGYGVHGPSPSYLSAWSRMKLGWAEVIDMNRAEPMCGEEIKSFLDGGKILRAWAYDRELEKEYFLIEFRKKAGFDSDLPSNGLLIWHIDEKMTSNNNEWRPDNEVEGKHYMVALEQPDRLYELETTDYRRCDEIADEGDYYRPGNIFTPYSIPDSSYYSGHFTGIWVKPVTFAGEETSGMKIVSEVNPQETFIAPSISNPPPTKGVVGERYSFSPGIIGSPPPEVELTGPEGAFFDKYNQRIEWSPEKPGSFIFKMRLINCAGEFEQEWNVQVEMARLKSDNETVYCLLSHISSDSFILNAGRAVKKWLLTMNLKSPVRIYYAVSKMMLERSGTFHNLLVDGIKGTAYMILFLILLPAFSLKKKKGMVG